MTNFLNIFKPIINNNINILWVGFFLFFLAISNPWFSLSFSSPEILKSYFASFGVTFLILIILYYKCQKPNISFNISYIKLTLIAFFIFGLLSIFWSINSELAIGKWLLWLIAAFSFVISTNLSLSYENLTKLAWALTITAFSIAIIGLFQHFSNPFAFPQSPTSTFGNKNIAVQVLVLIFPLSIFLICSKLVQGLKTWILLGLISIVITYIILSFTRGAWLSIFIELFCIAIYFVLKRVEVVKWIDWNANKRNATLAAIILTIIIVSLSPPNNLDNISEEILQRVSLTGAASDQSLIYRLETWRIAIEMFFDAPFVGSGLGSFAQNLGNEGYASSLINNATRAHNDLIELAVELGIIGLIFFLMVILSLIVGIVKILKQTTGEIHLFFFFLLVCLVGSFVNLQFSFPYQMAFPLVLFGLYSGLIAKQIDKISITLIKIKFSLKILHKQIILFIFSIFFFTTFFFTYFQWITFYDQLNRISNSGDFSQLKDIEMPMHANNIQASLYSLGGAYFNKGDYTRSKEIDKKFLEVWPNYLDVLYRLAYAEHATGQNSIALDLAKKLKKIEPDGLYNGDIVEMFIHLDTNDLIKFEQTFHELLLQPEEFLKQTEETYRMMIFFSLYSEKISKHAPSLYLKYIENYNSSCEIENNMAVYYINIEDYVNSLKHVNKVGQPQICYGCVNADLMELLRRKGLFSL